jgi:hypothetical protein
MMELFEIPPSEMRTSKRSGGGSYQGQATKNAAGSGCGCLMVIVVLTVVAYVLIVTSVI